MVAVGVGARRSARRREPNHAGVGTQFDGLGHVGTEINGEHVFYNGFKLSEFGTSYGLTKVGIENVGVIFTRGVLLDVARYKGVERLDPTYVITVDD